MTIFKAYIIILSPPFFILLKWWYWCLIYLARHLFFCTLFLADLILYCESYIPTILLEPNSKEIRKWMIQSIFFFRVVFQVKNRAFVLYLVAFLFLLLLLLLLFPLSYAMYFLMIPFWELYKNREITMRIFLFLNAL